MNRVKIILEKATTVFLLILVFATILIANLGVLCRYVLESPLEWSEEIIRFTFIWIIFIGAAIAYREESLISISLLVDLLKGKRRKNFDIITRVTCFIFILILVYEGIKILVIQLGTWELSPAVELPLWIVTAGFVAGSVFWLAYGASKLYKALIKNTD